MAQNNGPYYTSSSQAADGLRGYDARGDIYPELGHQTAPDAQMYTLANDALQVHQGRAGAHFAGLLQAATAAAGQEHTDVGQATGSDTRSDTRSLRKRKAPSGPDGGRKGLLNDSSGGLQQDTPYALKSRVSRKRKLLPDEAARQEDARDSMSNEESGLYPNANSSSLTSATTSSRRQSLTAKKSTRPPIEKIGRSVELATPEWLLLMAAAKTYMLDDRHPERMDTVGQRGKGDGELVRLRLWNCVSDFLEGEGNGQRFFGIHVPGEEGKQRTMFWPLHKTNIINVITPLMRRMVTNERQRRYAIDTRKSGSGTGESTNKRRKLAEPRAAPVINGSFTSNLDSQSAAMEPGLRGLFKDISGVSFDDYNAWRLPDHIIMLRELDDFRKTYQISDAEFDCMVALVDYHLRVSHGKGLLESEECDRACEHDSIGRILESGHLGQEHRASDAPSIEELHQIYPPVLQSLFHIVRLRLAPASLDQSTTDNEADSHDHRCQQLPGRLSTEEDLTDPSLDKALT